MEIIALLSSVSFFKCLFSLIESSLYISTFFIHMNIVFCYDLSYQSIIFYIISIIIKVKYKYYIF